MDRELSALRNKLANLYAPCMGTKKKNYTAYESISKDDFIVVLN